MVTIVKPYEPEYGDPIEFETGTTLEVGRESEMYPDWFWCRAPSGREGWVYKSFLNRAGNVATGVASYSSRELSVAGGERGRIVHWIGDWACIRLDNGVEGWIPQECVESLKVDS